MSNFDEKDITEMGNDYPEAPVENGQEENIPGAPAGYQQGNYIYETPVESMENNYPDIDEMNTPGNEENPRENIQSENQQGNYVNDTPRENNYPDIDELNTPGEDEKLGYDLSENSAKTAESDIAQAPEPQAQEPQVQEQAPVNNEPQAPEPQAQAPVNNEPQAQAPVNNEPQPQAQMKSSIIDQFVDLAEEEPQPQKNAAPENVDFNIPAGMSYLDPFLGNIKAEEILGKAPDLSGSRPDTSYTSKQAEVMLDALPATALEEHANRMKNIQLGYARDVRANGFDLSREQQAKTEMLRQIAEMKKLTSQGMMVAADDEIFSLGDKNGVNIFAGGKENILGYSDSKDKTTKDPGVVNAMDAKLEMVDAAIRKGWPMSDLNALGNMASLARSIKKLEKESFVGGPDKRKIEEFVNFVDELKNDDGMLKFDDRYEKIEEAKKLLEALPDEAREAEFEFMFEEAKKSLDAAYKHEPTKDEIGHTQNNWKDIKFKSITKDEFDALKKRTKEQMEAASSTLQAKCLTERGENEKALSKADAIKAYAVMFDKNGSMLHKDSPQFKQVKSGIKAVTQGKGTEADRQKLLEDVKKWITDPKYNRIKKHGGSSFDNKRFNDMFALANELDPNWARENFSRMNLCAHHGDKSSQFKDINEFLNHEHKLMIDNKCIENSAAQKNKTWYAGKAPVKAAEVKNGKVKNVKLSELEKKSGVDKKKGEPVKKPSQKKAVKKGPSHIM